MPRAAAPRIGRSQNTKGRKPWRIFGLNFLVAGAGYGNAPRRVHRGVVAGKKAVQIPPPQPKEKGPPCVSTAALRSFWLRGRDLNPRPLGYEPNELPDCSTPRQILERAFQRLGKPKCSTAAA